MKFCFFTLGCKVNQFETQSLIKLAVQNGHEICEENADAVVINTCTVTSVSEKKNIRAIKKLKSQNPSAIIALCGCFSQVSPQKAEDIDGVDIVCGTQNRADVLCLCENHLKENGKINTVKEHGDFQFEVLPAGSLLGRTRALLKVQDGCDNFCSYCIIPYARGRVRSMPLDIAIKEVQRLQSEHVREIVVTGIEISSYGKDFQEEISTIDLVEKMCESVPNIRIRLGSLEPRTITEEFCKRLCKFSNLANHFHLSLQSGCDDVLKRMNRKYNTELFLNGINLLRKYFDNPSLTTDVIVGFPGEDEREFNETLQFVQSCAFADAHVFPYSVRSGTRAEKMPNHIPEEIKATRAEKLKNTCAKSRQNFLKQQIGVKTDLIVENVKDNCITGHGNKDYIINILKYNGEINKNDVLSVEITDVIDGKILANIQKKLNFVL